MTGGGGFAIGVVGLWESCVGCSQKCGHVKRKNAFGWTVKDCRLTRAFKTVPCCCRQLADVQECSRLGRRVIVLLCRLSDPSPHCNSSPNLAAVSRVQLLSCGTKSNGKESKTDQYHLNTIPRNPDNRASKDTRPIAEDLWSNGLDGRSFLSPSCAP